MNKKKLILVALWLTLEIMIFIFCLNHNFSLFLFISFILNIPIVFALMLYLLIKYLPPNIIVEKVPHKLRKYFHPSESTASTSKENKQSRK